MSADIKRMDIREFREAGFLQELNRRFLHLAGLALEIEVDGDGNEYLGGIWDYRDDPEGIFFSSVDLDKVEAVDREIDRHFDARVQLFGSLVQPVDWRPDTVEPAD